MTKKDIVELSYMYDKQTDRTKNTEGCPMFLAKMEKK